MAVSLVFGLGLEHSCLWPREGLSSERLSLALVSSLVSSTPPLIFSKPKVGGKPPPQTPVATALTLPSDKTFFLHLTNICIYYSILN